KGARRDMVLLNAAAALVAAGRAADFSDGISQAAESIDTGRALEKLEGMMRITNEYKEE
ncbi:MAG: anthranilate phosphoribosyltransferase, partial [Deltaproteobacteria bacterium]|nr:anthranilate phosphoribosyltransferase [Deltaproteobacteria bacterium]